MQSQSLIIVSCIYLKYQSIKINWGLYIGDFDLRFSPTSKVQWKCLAVSMLIRSKAKFISILGLISTYHGGITGRAPTGATNTAFGILINYISAILLLFFLISLCSFCDAWERGSWGNEHLRSINSKNLRRQW